MNLEDAARAVVVARERRKQMAEILDRHRTAYLQACAQETAAIETYDALFEATL